MRMNFLLEQMGIRNSNFRARPHKDRPRSGLDIPSENSVFERDRSAIPPQWQRVSELIRLHLFEWSALSVPPLQPEYSVASV